MISPYLPLIGHILLIILSLWISPIQSDFYLSQLSMYLPIHLLSNSIKFYMLTNYLSLPV